VESYLLYSLLPLGLSLWAFFTLGSWISSSFDDVSSSYPAVALLRLEHLHGRQHFSQRPCYRRPSTQFAVGENLQQATVDFSTLFVLSGCLVKTRASFYSTEFGLPLFLFFSSRSDRLAPYCYFTFFPGTHTYLAGIHNYFFTFQTMTTVHHSLPLGGCYCTFSFHFFKCTAKIDGILASPGLQSCRACPCPG